MSDSSIIEARLGALENRLSEVQARLQKTESTQTFKLEAGVVSIEEAPLKNATISAASDECITANREAIIENAITSTGCCNESSSQDVPDDVPVDAVSITLRKHDGSIALRLKAF